MSDQMPDEVLIDRRMHAWRPKDWHLLDRREGQVRYVRGDLYERAERAEAERDDARARVEHLLTEICGGAANRHALAERLREVEAERDRLRAALERIVDIDTDWRMGVAENMGRCMELAEEALRDD